MHWCLPVIKANHAYAVSRLFVKFRFASRLHSTSIEVQPSARKHSSKPRLRVRWQIHTLDPSRLSPSDFMDISLRTTKTLGIIFGTQDHLAHGIIKYYHKNYVLQPFPPGTQGFLYYHRPFGKPPTAGSIRFRITTSQDPTTFGSGTDLLLPTGVPWKQSVLVIAGAQGPRSSLVHLRRLLLTDRLITANELEACRKVYNMTDYTKAKPDRSCQIVHSFDDHFFVRFDRHYNSIFLIADGVKQNILLSHLFWRGLVPHYSGSAICRFEPSTLPSHQGTRTVVARIVKIVSSVQRLVPESDCLVQEPTEGGLVLCTPRGRYYEGMGLPWSIDVDKTPYTALRTFFSDD